MAQKKSQLPLLLGLTAAGGVGYYLYNAGGNAKVAEKDFERTFLSPIFFTLAIPPVSSSHHSHIPASAIRAASSNAFKTFELR